MCKSIMRCLGVELGGVRLPLTNLTAGQELALKEELKSLGML